MANRRPIKQEHERYYIDEFLRYLNRNRKHKFCVTDTPDPPDAIIKSKNSTRWIEVTDAFFSNEFAQDLYSYVTPCEEHKPVKARIHCDFDRRFATRFVDGLQKKLRKQSYEECYRKYGQGYLIVVIINPLFDDNTIHKMKELWVKTDVPNCGYFRSIHLAYSSLNEIHFSTWPISS